MFLKRLIIFLLCSFFAVLALNGCKDNSSNQAELIAVKVETVTLSTKAFANEMAHRLRNYDALRVKDRRTLSLVKESIVNDFILQAIVQLWAQENSISISSDELEAAIQKIRSQYPDDLTFRRNLARERLSFEAWKMRLRQSLLGKKVLAQLAETWPVPTINEMKKFYKENPSQFQNKAQIKVQQIVSDRKEKAELLLKKIRRGAKFEDLTKYSNSPEKQFAGITDWIDIDTLDIFKKAYRLNKKKVTSVLESPFGFHIMRIVDKRKAGKVPFETAKDKIRKLLLERKEEELYSQWLDKQIRKRAVFKNQKVIAALAVHTENE